MSADKYPACFRAKWRLLFIYIRMNLKKNMKRSLEAVDDVLINKIRLTNNARNVYLS